MRLPKFPVTSTRQGATLAALCVLYLLTGLIGHDPWKNEDAIHFGVAYGFLNGGNWLIPAIAGESLPGVLPLYYWVAALCGRLFDWLLPLHDAVRLASGLFGALFLALLGLAGRTLYTPAQVKSNEMHVSVPAETGGAAILIALGSLGLLVPIHDTQPLVALLAASAATYAGLALLPQRPLPGGALAGLGLGLGFLASGLTALINLLPLLLLLPFNRHWRSTASLRGLIVTLAISIPLCASWPLLLAWQKPDALSTWWSHATGNVHYQNDWLRTLPHLAELLAWFAWPALPLAFWAVWLNRHRLGQAAIALPLTGTLTTLLTLLLLAEPRPLQALPLLVPLILLAASSAGQLRRGATNAFDWFGMMTFTLLACLIWLGGIAMTSGIPRQIAHNFAKLEPGFVAHFSSPAYVAAALLSLAWLWLIFAAPRSSLRAVTHWAAGTTLMWALLMTLWLPWIDYGKTYRNVAVSLKQALPKGAPCIAGKNLGSVQRVYFEYFAGIVTLRAGTPAAAACPLLLEQTNKASEAAPPGWRKLWEGHRSSDKSERIRLYQRGKR